MATKAQLEAELAELKAKAAEETPTPPEQPNQDPDEPDEARSALDEMLSAHGLDAKEIEALWTQFSTELGDLPQQKPLLTAIAAFGLGFVLGRMSKS